MVQWMYGHLAAFIDLKSKQYYRVYRVYRGYRGYTLWMRFYFLSDKVFHPKTNYLQRFAEVFVAFFKQLTYCWETVLLPSSIPNFIIVETNACEQQSTPINTNVWHINNIINTYQHKCMTHKQHYKHLSTQMYDT